MCFVCSLSNPEGNQRPEPQTILRIAPNQKQQGSSQKFRQNRLIFGSLGALFSMSVLVFAGNNFAEGSASLFLHPPVYLPIENRKKLGPFQSKALCQLGPVSLLQGRGWISFHVCLLGGFPFQRLLKVPFDSWGNCQLPQSLCLARLRVDNLGPVPTPLLLLGLVAQALCLTFKWFTTVAALSLALPAGVVAPSLVIGGLLGRLFAQLLPETCCKTWGWATTHIDKYGTPRPAA